jgi:amino acid adenylation domain-containing protein
MSYWQEKLRGLSPLQLPSDYQRPLIQECAFSNAHFMIAEPVSECLKALSRQSDTSVFTTLLAAFNMLLHRHTNQEDICVGHGFGSYNRILPLRTHLDGNMPFSELLQEVKKTLLEAFAQAYIPIEALADSIDREHDPSRNNLFQVMFNEQTTEGSFMLPLTQRPDLSFTICETAAGFHGTVTYDTALFTPATISRMTGHYITLLTSLISHPSQKIGALPMLTAAEQNDIVADFNATITPYHHEKTLADLFEEQVIRTPDLIALRHGELTLTYNELNTRANRLARLLIDRGVSNEDSIGILMTRGFDMIIGMYAILKAGGAYVPIDPEYPLDRQEYIFRNSFVKLILADQDYPLKGMIGPDAFLEMDKLQLDEYDTVNPRIHTAPTQLAYTIYTSGSTGRPKGVMIEHHMAVNLVQWVNKEFSIGEDDRLLFITSMCFDLSVYDVFGILSAGASIVIANPGQIRDVKALHEMLTRYNITFWDSVPTTMDYMVRTLELAGKDYRQTSLRVVFMSGDWIPVNLPDRIRKYFPSTRVISLGGATEGTVWSNFYPVEKTPDTWSSIPYGKPLQNNFFYILNPQLQPVPVGVVGELYIGGVGVARGYANDKEKTDYAFVKDPFNDQAGGRMYRTGDLGRMSPDLNMEFIGRKDDQVKIRGFRVELGEIESVLKQSNGVKQAVVLAKLDPDGKKRLVGYVVPNGPFNREMIMKHLLSKLPDYMVPGAWVELDSLPLTSNGKIDKKSLPDFNDHEAKDQYAAPRNPTDKILVEIWQRAFGLKKVGIDDHFFEQGGHSLIAVEIITDFDRQTGKNLPLAILYKYPTIRQFVDALEETATSDKIWKSLVPIKSTGTKMPVYIVHGDGLNVLNFNLLANYVDDDQPVYGLQAHGLNGDEPAQDDMTEIARHYIREILEQNPDGPYAVGGYSFGGYIAIEMRRQLEAMGKEVKLLAIFDTNAEASILYAADWSIKLPMKLKRQFPKLIFFTKCFFKRPITTIKYQWEYVKNLGKKIGLIKTPQATGIYINLNRIQEKHLAAFKKYNLEPFDGKIHLFRAIHRLYFVGDSEYLGWKDYAKQGVIIYEVPGDHKTMFQEPHAKKLAASLQHALDNC